MTDLKPEDLVKLRGIAGALCHVRKPRVLCEEASDAILSLLADRARMEKAIELLAEVYEAARDVSMAAVQDDGGEWSIKGDPEAMLGRLCLATEEVRKVSKGASQ